MKRVKELFNWSIKDLIKLLIGTFMFCLAINVFVVPNELYSGGVLGLSQLIRSIVIDAFDLNISFDFSGILYYLINIPLFVLAYKNLSKQFLQTYLLCVQEKTWLASFRTHQPRYFFLLADKLLLHQLSPTLLHLL